MNRIDLYANAHKGLRALLFQAAAQAARTDPDDDREVTSLASRVRELVAWLDQHAEHEDAVVMPVLAQIAPDLHAALRADHARVDGLQREVESWVARLDATAGPARRSALQRLHERLLRLTAEHLQHMATEESDANRMLWAHRTDAQILELQAAIRASTPRSRAAAWLAVTLPALSVPERAALLAPLKGAVPQPALDELVGPVRAALGVEWTRTVAAAGW